MDLPGELSIGQLPKREHVAAKKITVFNRERKLQDHRSYGGDKKERNVSKLPRIVKTPQPQKDNFRMYGESESGDTRAGPSGVSDDFPYFSSMNRREESPDKKRSYIPRRRSSTKVDQKEDEQNTSPIGYPPRQNVQRVHVLNICPDFGHEHRVDTTSIAAAKPVPTLGHIYRSDLTQNDRLDSWFMESVDEYLTAPCNSLASAVRAISRRTERSGESSRSAVDSGSKTPYLDNTERPATAVYQESIFSRGYKATNQNYCDWLRAELDRPIKDDESGYRSISPTGTSVSRSKQGESMPARYLRPSSKAAAERDMNNGASGIPTKDVNRAATLAGSATVDMRSADKRELPAQDANSKTIYNSGCINPTGGNKTHQFPSCSVPLNSVETRGNTAVVVPSYVECSSEILQRTTNLETDTGITSPIAQSLAGTDLEIRDAFSQYTLEQLDDYLEEECNHSRAPNTNPFTCKSHSSVNSVQGSGFRHECTDDAATLCVVKNDCGLEWRKRTVKIRRGSIWRRIYDRRIRKRIKNSLNTRPLRNVRGICRTRWDRVWQKTTEHCVSWVRPPNKFKRFRMLFYLQRSLLFEDVDVQTTMLVFRHTATGSSIRDQKSVAIATSLRLNSWLALYNKSNFRTSNAFSQNSKLRSQYLSRGPSMFPMFLNCKIKSVPEKMGSTLKQMHQNHSYGGRSNTISDFGSEQAELSKNQFSKQTPGPNCCFTEETKYLTSSDKSSSWPTQEKVKVNTTNQSSMTFVEDRQTQDIFKLKKIITCDTSLGTVNKFPPSYSSNSSGTLTSRFEPNTCFFKPCVVNPAAVIRHSFTKEPKRTLNVMTSGDQYRETATQQKQITISKGFTPSRIFAVKPPVLAAGTSCYNVQTKDCATETDPVETILDFTDIKLMSISSAKLETTSTITSRELIQNTETSTRSDNFAIEESISMRGLPEPAHELGSKSVSISTNTDSRVETESVNIKAMETVKAPLAMKFKSEMMRFDKRIRIDAFVQYNSNINKNVLCKPGVTVGTNTQIDLQTKSFQLQNTDTSLQSGKHMKHTCIQYSIPENNFEEYLIRCASTDTAMLDPIELPGASSPDYRKDVQIQMSDTEFCEANPKLCVGTNTNLGLVTVEQSILSDELETEFWCKQLCADFSTVDSGVQCSDYAKRQETLHSQPPVVSYHKPSATLSRFDLGDAAPVLLTPAKVSPDDGFECSSTTPSECQPRIKLPKAMSSCIYSRRSTGHPKPPKALSFDSRRDEPMFSLSRLLQWKYARSRDQMTETVVSSSMNADKWIKGCTFSVDKDYQSLLDLTNATSDSLNQVSVMYPSSSSPPLYGIRREPSKLLSTDTNNPHYSNIAFPKLFTTTRTMDSMTGVFPTHALVFSQNSINKLQVMVDKATSGEAISKDVKESTLQASPEICDASTEFVPVVKQQKSASAFTSRCVLPPPCCKIRGKQDDDSDCLFVYDRPRCVIHRSKVDASCQMLPSRHDVEHAMDQSVGSFSSDRSARPAASLPRADGTISEVLTPRVYKALYETTRFVTKNESKLYRKKSGDSTSCPVETENGSLYRSPPKTSAAMLTSQLSFDGSPCCCDRLDAQPLAGNPPRCPSTIDKPVSQTPEPAKTSPSVLQSRCDLECLPTHCCTSTQLDSTLMCRPQCQGSSLDCRTQFCATCRARLLEIPRRSSHHDIGAMEECVNTHLLGSCRYYSDLLSRHFGRVRDKLTKHITAPSTNQCVYQFAELPYSEACTMKPSGREELGCQTRQKLQKPVSCCYLSPALSVTDICRGQEKENLKSLYYMLTAIEGRIRRLKQNIST